MINNELRYSDKEKAVFIQKSLKNGLSREKLAVMLGYKNWRSLDIFMRRQGMKWNTKQNSYFFPDDSDATGSLSNSSSPKADIIISLFKDRNADPREIAKRMGFNDHRDLASYMSEKGFVWSEEDRNYIKAVTRQVETAEELDLPENFDLNLNKYIPLFEILIKHKERLLSLILPSSSPGTIPRYTIPGLTRTKSFYMSESISRLISEFSSRNNISQKEVIEAAVIEFLRKYSFEKEVNSMINS